MNIRVKSQDQDHQYDAQGNIISSWNDDLRKYVILPQYHDRRIKWGARCDHAVIAPEPTHIPEISISWTWDTPQIIEEQFGLNSHGEPFMCPLSNSRSWRWNHTRQEALDHCVQFFTKCSSMMVLYDKEILFSMRPDGTQYLADGLTLNL